MWKKIKEIFLEVFIIVFAVSLSIWFHNLNEEKENAHKESEFFKGILNDLKKDNEEWKKEKTFYINQIAILNRQICIGEQSGNCDSIKATYDQNERNIPRYTPVHNSYFEASKYSGSFSTIENKTLLLSVINYYQEAIPFIQAQKELYNEEHTRMLNAFRDNAVFDKNNGYNFEEMLKKPAVLFQVKMMKNSIYIIDNYTDIINKTDKLIKEIESIEQ